MSFGAHLAACAEQFDFDDLCGTDEAMLALYLLSLRPAAATAPVVGMGEAVRACTIAFSHPLRARGDDPPPLAPWPPAIAEAGPPTYAKQRARKRRFAFDAEVPKRVTMRRLAWEAPRRPSSARASSRSTSGRERTR